VGVRRSREGGWRRWCGFKALASAREGRPCDEALSEDKVEIVSSSWLHGKKV
jgi:hypothetical protein